MDMPMKKKRTIAAQAAARGPLPELPPEQVNERKRQDDHYGSWPCPCGSAPRP